MENVELDHLASLSGSGIYSYIGNSHQSKPFHDFVEKNIKNTIGDFKNPYMDRADLAKLDGWYNHRWKHPGHDPIDITKSIITDPMGRGQLDAGHFVTDFFTKAGMPLPGMSKEYLGGSIVNTLESIGVEKPIKWLNMNGFDHFFGWSSLIESGDDTSIALSDEAVDFTWETAFDTFGEGTLEIYFGLQTTNIIMLTSGINEYAAGSILLYKDMKRDHSSIYENLLNNLPNQVQLTTALGFYLTLSSVKNYIYYTNGKITKDQLNKTIISETLISLSSFAITKSLITTMAVGGVTGGMLLPLLIGGSASLLLKQLFETAFPNHKISISENDLWSKSPIQYNSPWTSDIYNNGNELWQKTPQEYTSIWSQNIFDNNDNIWQKDLLKNWVK
jgi:hypothetical protein